MGKWMDGKSERELRGSVITETGLNGGGDANGKSGMEIDDDD